jgi:hypothetical protein
VCEGVCKQWVEYYIVWMLLGDEEACGCCALMEFLIHVLLHAEDPYPRLYACANADTVQSLTDRVFEVIPPQAQLGRASFVLQRRHDGAILRPQDILSTVLVTGDQVIFIRRPGTYLFLCH